MKITDHNSSYPIIRIDGRIISYLNGEIPELEMPNPPNKPTEQSKQFPLSDIILPTMALVVFLLVSLFYENGFMIRRPCLLFYLIYWFYSIIKHYREKGRIKRGNKERENRYEKDLKDYNIKVVEISKFRKELSQNENRDKYVKNKISCLLKSSTNPVTIFQDTTRGITELYFVKALKSIFGEDCIYTNKTVPFQESYKKSYHYDNCNYDYYDYEFPQKAIRHYMPDVLFDDGILKIDIEIDEPYSFQTKLPIHYYDEEKHRHVDIERDIYFLSNGWVVIRFAEIQIVNNTLGCCMVIAQTISDITGNNSYCSILSKSTFPDPIKFWTYNDAEELATEKFRNSYLDHFQREMQNDYNLLQSMTKDDATDIANIDKVIIKDYNDFSPVDVEGGADSVVIMLAQNKLVVENNTVYMQRRTAYTSISKKIVQKMIESGLFALEKEFPFKGKIILEESLEPFWEDQQPKINPTTQEIVKYIGNPIFRRATFVYDENAQDFILNIKG